jgi:hypothetical protein
MRLVDARNHRQDDGDQRLRLDNDAVVSRAHQYVEGRSQAVPYPTGAKALPGRSVPNYGHLPARAETGDNLIAIR